MSGLPEIIHILCATDNNYAPYCGIMLTSLCESNRDCRFNVYVFLDGCLSEVNQRKFKKLEYSYSCKINFVHIDDKLIGVCPVNRQRNVDNHAWVSKPTYYRLLAAKLLPKDVQKVIYLDCDIAVIGDIKPLWNVDLSGKAVAGVMDCDEESNSKRLGLPSQSTYINAGVALYNLDYWREHHVSNRFFDFIREHETELLLMDQDVVNGVLCDQTLYLPERYNFQVAFFTGAYWRIYPERFRKTLLSENKEAVIIHYVGGLKPWDYKYYGSPYYTKWNKYRRMSFWGESHVTTPKMVYVKFLVKKLFFSKALRKKRQAIWAVLPENEFCYE